MSLSHTTGEEHSGGLCPNSCKKSFLVPLQEDLASALMAEIQMEDPFFEPPPDGSGWQSKRKRQQKCHVVFGRKPLTGTSVFT